MRRLIVSDFHLDPSEPERYFAIIDALSQCKCDQLILAGDIFEAWVGDDGVTDVDRHFLEFCGQHCDDVVFIHGNRDFLISDGFLTSFGIRLESQYLGDAILVIHGDELCTLDHAYQAFKREVRQPEWIQTFLNKPLIERQAIAEELRRTSRETQANRAEAIGDAVDEAVDGLMENQRASVLIHGHTHRPAMHYAKGNLRAVTSDWTHSGLGVVVDSMPSELTVSLTHLSAQGALIKEQWVRQTGTPEWNRNS